MISTDKKLAKILSIMKGVNNLDNKLFELLNESLYEKMVSPLIMKIEDLLFLSLFDQDYWEIHEGFATPGMSEVEKTNKVILWDHENGGYPPEKLLDLFRNQKDMSQEDLIAKIKTQINLIKTAQKDKNV